MKFNLKSYFTFLSRNKAYTAVNVFGLAVSLTFVMIIGLYTWQEFSINYQHGKAKRIYNIGLRFQDSINVANCHHAVLRYMRNRYPEIEKTCGFTTQVIKVTDNDDFVNMKALASDSTFFDMFDFKLLRGDRTTCLMQKNNVVLTQKFARKFFGTDDVLGRVLATTEHGKLRVTGVVADFDNTIINKDIEAIVDFSHTTNLAVKDEYFPSMVNVTGAASFVQVREGCDFAAKQADVAEYFKKFWGAAYPPVLTRLDKLYFSGAEAWQALRLGNFTLVKILLAVGIVILLFSIMNYVNLTVAQSGYRAREMATRRLFGCKKGDVGVNMFAESLVMCFISCLLALLLTAVCAPYAGRLLDTEIDVSLLFNPLAICVIVVFILLVSFLSGVFPASILSRVNPIEVVRGTFRKQTKMFFSRVFITLQNVITIVMLACALIMSLQMRHLVKAPLGLNTENIIALSVNDISGGRYTAEFIDKLRALPFVKHVAPSNGIPTSGGNNKSVRFEEEEQEWPFQFINCTAEMLDIYGITLKTDNHLQGDSIIYINEMAMNGLQMKLTDTHMSNRYKRVRYSYFSKNGRFGGLINDFRIHNILEDMRPMIIQVCPQIRN